MAANSIAPRPINDSDISRFTRRKWQGIGYISKTLTHGLPVLSIPHHNAELNGGLLSRQSREVRIERYHSTCRNRVKLRQGSSECSIKYCRRESPSIKGYGSGCFAFV